MHPTETSYEHYIRKRKWLNQRYEFSSQMLACCQQLYREGRHILYKENIASIQSDYSDFVSVPGHTVEIRYKFYSVDELNNDDDLLSAGRLASKIVHRLEDDDIRQLYPALAEFSHFNILLTPHNDVDMFMMVYQLRNLLRHKKVLLRLDMASAEKRNIWLTSCRVWRCDDITFVGQKGDVVERLRKKIMGTEIVYNGLDAWRAVRDVKTKIDELKGASTQEVEQEYLRLQGAVTKCSARSVVKHKFAFIEAVRKAVKIWEEEKIAELKKQQRDVKIGSKKLLGALAKIES